MSAPLFQLKYNNMLHKWDPKSGKKSDPGSLFMFMEAFGSYFRIKKRSYNRFLAASYFVLVSLCLLQTFNITNDH